MKKLLPIPEPLGKKSESDLETNEKGHLKKINFSDFLNKKFEFYRLFLEIQFFDFGPLGIRLLGTPKNTEYYC